MPFFLLPEAAVNREAVSQDDDGSARRSLAGGCGAIMGIMFNVEK